MRAYLREFATISQVERALESIGPDPAAIPLMREKAGRYCILIKDVKSPAANIIKQEMLAAGGDAAVSKGAVICTPEKASVLLLGTVKEIRKGAERLKKQYFGLAALGEDIAEMLDNLSRPAKDMELGRSGNHILNLSRPAIMGILNVTPDSFSDGGRFTDPEKAIQHALSMVESGADIIDIGGESTRPGSKPISAEEEMKRILPVIKGLNERTDVPLSVDTSKPEVARVAVEAGASIINDVYGARKEGMAEVMAETGVPVVIMHMLGDPQTMQKRIEYDDVMDDIVDFFRERIEFLTSAGVKAERIIIDPGIGFGKTAENNLEILNRLGELKVLGRPILIGTSRKSFIGAITGKDVDSRLYGSLASAIIAVMNGSSIVRVHDVRETADAMRMIGAVSKENILIGQKQ